MSNVFVDKNKIDLLANAISAKSGESLTLTLDEMVEAVDGIDTSGGGITPTGNIDISSAGVTDVTNYATATVPQGEMFAGYSERYATVSGVRKWKVKPYAAIVIGDSYGTPGFINDNTVTNGAEGTYNAIAKNTTVTPTTSAQTIGGANYMMEGAVTVNAMPTMTLPSSTSATSSGTSKATITPSSSVQYLNIPTGYNGTTQYYTISASGGGGGGGGNSKDPVKFIDYDGTILHSYSVSDFMALTTMPANPSHSGLTSQGWNWSLADAKAYLTDYPEAELTIGQMYITDDGKTRLYVHFEEGRLHPYLGICPNGTIVVDWGDNSATSTLTGTSLATIQHADHEYASAGDYIITLTVSSGSFAFYGVKNTSHILKKDTSIMANIHHVYTNCLQKVEIGASASIGDYAFNYCYSLASITIPNAVMSIGNSAFYNCYSLDSVTIPDTVTSIETYAFYGCYFLASITIPNAVMSIGNSAFYGCYSLDSVTIPDTVTNIGSNAFSYCYSLASIMIPNTVTSIEDSAFSYCHSLTSITIPDTVTSIKAYAFYHCYSLTSITIPNTVTSIGNNAFSYCYGMAEYHFLSTTPPTLASTKVFYNIQSDCVIYVPQESLSAYKTASNWSTYASYMQGE